MLSPLRGGGDGTDYETPVIKSSDLSAVRETMREEFLDEDEDECIADAAYHDDDHGGGDDEARSPERVTDMMPLTSGYRSSQNDSSSRDHIESVRKLVNEEEGEGDEMEEEEEEEDIVRSDTSQS